MSAHYTAHAKNVSMRVKRFINTFSNESIIPFGKYKGSKVLDLKLHDSQYYDWLLTKLKLK